MILCDTLLMYAHVVFLFLLVEFCVFFHPILYYLTFSSKILCIIFFSFKNCHMIFVGGKYIALEVLDSMSSNECMHPDDPQSYQDGGHCHYCRDSQTHSL